MSEKHYDAAVVGAGPGGYVAAIRLAQLGKKTVCIDAEKLGGVCLNWGCIPSKALIHAGKVFEQITKAHELGITVSEPTIDLQKLVGWKDGIVDRLTGGVGHLLKSNGVDTIMGRARLADARTLIVEGEDETTTVRAGGIILATGSRSIEIPGFEFDGETIHNNRSILALTTPPKRLVVIGGGVIGLELGTFFSKIGTELTVVEWMDQLLPGTDKALVKVVQRELKKAKVKIHLSSKAKGVRKTDDGLEVDVETTKGDIAIPCDAVLVTVGRRPNSEKLGLEAAGVATSDRGFVTVDKRLETTAPGVFAIGDLVGQPLLAHKASKEGIVAAEALAGLGSTYDVLAMPGAIFTDPEIATVGLTEAQARDAGYTPITGSFPFSASGRALSTQDAHGFVQLVADAASGAVLGAGIVGPEASNLIAEAALAIELGATLEDLASTVHAHPTLPECLMEAAEDALGHAIHIPKKKGQ